MIYTLISFILGIVFLPTEYIPGMIAVLVIIVICDKGIEITERNEITK